MTHSQMLATIDSILDKVDIKYRTYDYENGWVRFVNALDDPRVKFLTLGIIVHEKRLTVYGRFPVHVDSNDVETIRAVAEFICRVNYGLNYGHFDLDPNDGEIVYTTTISCFDGEAPEEDEIMAVLFATVKVFNRYASGLLSVIYQGEWPKIAYERSEEND
ncbi:MAG: hypothetical protein Q4G03_06955 [Planctomycetia bacterium]|nr:hypothetical protein [Planctomycetia bacterium]